MRLASLALLASTLFAACPGAAWAQDPTQWDAAPHVRIALSSFDFTPATIELVHGQPYVLDLVNTGGGGHNFAAPDFFRTAAMAPRDATRVRHGKVEVEGHEQLSLRIIAPAAGDYRLSCTHFLHKGFGMKGLIRVR